MLFEMFSPPRQNFGKAALELSASSVKTSRRGLRSEHRTFPFNVQRETFGYRVHRKSLCRRPFFSAAPATAEWMSIDVSLLR
jgi:hypothetical protein